MRKNWAPFQLSLIAATCIILSSCTTATKEEEEREDVTPINNLCNSSIANNATDSVKEIADSSDLHQGENTPTMNSVMKRLNSANATGERVQACHVYRSSASTGSLQFEVEFSRVESPLERRKKSEGPDGGDRTQVFYPLGEYARVVHGDYNSAQIDFSCSKGAPNKDSRIIRSHLFIPQGNKENVRPAMVILNSFSRKLAQELGCESEAQLPKRVPEPST